MNFESLFYLDDNMWPLPIFMFLRIVSFFVWIPIYGERTIPNQVRILLALSLTFYIWSFLNIRPLVYQDMVKWDALSLGILTLREVFFSLSMAFVGRMAIYVASMAASLAGINMGFQTGSMFSQTTGQSESSFGILYSMLVLVLMCILNIDHFFLRAIIESFETVPLAMTPHFSSLLETHLDFIRICFIFGLKVAAPLLAVQFMISLLLVLVGRTVPQLNVFLLNFPLGFLVSMVILFVGGGTIIRYLSTDLMELNLELIWKAKKSFEWMRP